MHTNDSASSIANDCFVKAKELAANDQDREAIEFLFASIALSDGENFKAREMLAKVFFNNAQYAQVIEQCDLIDPDSRDFTLNELRRKAQRELLDSKYKRERPPVRKSKAPGLVLFTLVVLSISVAAVVLSGYLFKEPTPVPIEQVANTYYQNVIQYPGLEQTLVVVNSSNNTIEVSGEVPSQTHKFLLTESGRQWQSIAEFNLDQVVIAKGLEEPEGHGGPGGPQEQNMLTYIIKPGDTLSKIALTHYKDPNRWTEILAANPETIKSPRSISVGLKINIPLNP